MDEQDRRELALWREDPSQITAGRIEPDELDFLHATLCQVGLPRSKTAERSFERRSGLASVLVEAGQLWNGAAWVPQPLPYGPKARLILAQICGEAIRAKSPQIDLGASLREFLVKVGLPTTGPVYQEVRRQTRALAACRMTLGTVRGGRSVTISTQPIERFEAWLHGTGEQATLWDGELRLSDRFFETLRDHAVPLDHAALWELKGSALALDIYTWLAYRLCRVKEPEGALIPWPPLREQFGQEYGEARNFKREFKKALGQVRCAYLEAKVEWVRRKGLRLHYSEPPVPQRLAVGKSAR